MSWLLLRFAIHYFSIQTISSTHCLSRLQLIPDKPRDSSPFPLPSRDVSSPSAGKRMDPTSASSFTTAAAALAYNTTLAHHVKCISEYSPIRDLMGARRALTATGLTTELALGWRGVGIVSRFGRDRRSREAVFAT
ncbi:hypothetical protein EDB85DRAFT_1949697 [Lactarius pseudohatsudake]|nr:hypothetical protein EDB85DRAFT_1949697 [Lactarius pseudohatsudake]